jgi:autotransporter-associated beta strand protein
MSPTKRTSADRQLFTTNLKFVVQAVRIMLAAAIVLAMVWPASAAAIAWTSITNGLWSNSANWTPTGTPILSSDVLFTNLTGNPSLNNEVGSSLSINSLQYSQDSAIYTTKIDPSVMMRILGAATAPAGSNGAVSLWAGAAGPTSESISQTLFTGGGQMDISNLSGGNTGGDIIVRESQGTAGAHNAILDLSGLASLNANVDQVLVGFSSASSGSGDRPNGTLYLARSNTITMNDTAYSTSGNGIRDAGLIVGYTAHGTAASNSAQYLYLGQTNVLNVANVTIAGARATSTMTFNPAFISSTPTLTMRGIAGGDSRVSNIVIGDNWGDAAGKTNTAAGTLDLTGGVADIKADTITLGRFTQNGGSASTATVARGTLTFNAGTIDVNNLILGYQSAVLSAATTQGYGRVNVNGTANLVVHTGLELGHVVTSGSLTPVEGTLNIRNTATVTMGGDITDGGITAAGATSAINMSGGTLNMQGHNIGSSVTPIDTFTASGGGITNLGNLTVSSFKVTNNYSLSSGTLTISNSGNIDMRNSAGNTLTAGNLTLPASSTLYFDLSGSAASGNDTINIGKLTLNGGTTALKITPLSGSFDSAPYHLITFTSTENTTNFTINNTTRNVMTPSVTGTGVDLSISSVQARNLTWKPAVTSGTWNWNTTANWTNQDGNDDTYYDLDTVAFGNSTGAVPVSITLQNTYPGSAGVVGFYPASVTVNADNDYTLIASTTKDRISGTTGLTKSGSGTLYLNLTNDYTGITNLSAGKIVLNNPVNGTDSALGNATAALIISDGATLELNNRQLYGKPITVQGAGVGSNGAIVNTATTAPGATQYDVSNITLSGDTTIGGTSTTGPTNPGLPGHQYIGRWSVRANSGTATINGNGYNLTKVGNNQIMLVNVSVDSTLADVNVNMGVLGIEGTSNLGDPTKTVKVDGTGAGQPSGGSMFQLNKVTVPLNKKIALKNNGVLYALGNTNTTDNTVLGDIAIDTTGGIFNAGGLRDDYAATPTAQMTLSGVIGNVNDLAPGTLTKAGPGTVTITNTANTFSGMTNLNDGTLVLNGNLPGGVTMAAGTVTTTLAGTGTVGGTVTDAVGTIIAPGGSAAAGTLTLGSLNINPSGGGTIQMDLSNNISSGNDLLSLTGSLTLNGTTTIAINPLNGINSLALGTYRLINYGATLSGSAATNLTYTGVPTDSRKTFTLVDTGPGPNGHIDLTVGGTAEASLVWKGDGSGNYWDVKTTANWYNPGPPVVNPDMFYTNDNVTFDDSTANKSVNITSTYVSPASITVNTAGTYSFTGNKISGSTGLTKSGTGTLILANYGNDYTGTTTINAGTLQIGDGSTANGNTGTGAIVNNASLVLNRTDISLNITSVISGTGTLEQRGGGLSGSIVTLAGVNTYSGITTITSGTLMAGNAAALGAGNGTTADPLTGTVIANGATLDINNQTLATEAITVQGQGVYGPGGYGAIVNNNQTVSTTPQNGLRFVTLNGDTYFGGSSTGAFNSGRWDIRGTGAYLSTGGNPYTLTKAGNNQVSLVGVTVDPALGNVVVNSGILSLEGATTGLGNPNPIYAVTVNGNPGGIAGSDLSILNLYNLSTPLNKNVVLNGGMLYAQSGPSSTNNTISGPVAITDTGGILNAGGIRSDVTTAIPGANMTITGVISGTSAATLTKLGPGTVTLTNANTFNGMTNLNDGTLIVNGSLGGGVTMLGSSASTTTLGGIGTINGPVSDYYSTNISPGATTAAGSVGTLTFANNLSLGFGGSGTITLDLTNTPTSGNDLINVVGALSLNGSTNVAINIIGGSLQGGGTQYPLIRYGSLPSGNASNFAPPIIDSRQTYSIVNNTTNPSAKSIDLVVNGSVANLVWTGGLNSNAWDVKTTTNWSGGGDSLFWNCDQVTFGNSGSNSPAVNIASTVLPGSVTVNSTQNYTFSGTGKISGGTSLTKSGSGTLTISTSNDYTGTTTINGGILKLDNASALGGTTGGVVIANGGTLDLNVLQLGIKPVTVQGAGAGGIGAIVNNNTTTAPAGTQYDVSNVTLSGDTTIGGTSTTGPTNPGLPGNQYIGRWSLRASSGTATLSTGGYSYNLTKVGNNQIILANVAVDSALADVYVNKGVLSLEGTTTLGNAAKTVTVDGSAGGAGGGGAILQLRTLSASLNKNVLLTNNGQLYALLNNASTDNTVLGTVTLGSTGGIFNAGGLRDDYAANPAAIMSISGNITGTGGLTKSGPGTAIITSMNVNYNGNTAINEGTLQINSGVGAAIDLNAVTGTGTLGVGNGTAATSITADSINIGTLTLGIGARITIAPLPGGPTAGAGSLTSVPEPSTWAMLMLAVMGLGMYWRRSR